MALSIPIQEGIPAAQIAKWEQEAADLREQIERAHERLTKIEEILRAVALVRNALEGKAPSTQAPPPRLAVTETVIAALKAAPNRRLTRSELRAVLNARSPNSEPIKHNAFFTTLNRLKKRGRIQTTSEHVVLVEE